MVSLDVVTFPKTTLVWNPFVLKKSLSDGSGKICKGLQTHGVRCDSRFLWFLLVLCRGQDLFMSRTTPSLRNRLLPRHCPTYETVSTSVTHRAMGVGVGSRPTSFTPETEDPSPVDTLSCMPVPPSVSKEDPSKQIRYEDTILLFQDLRFYLRIYCLRVPRQFSGVPFHISGFPLLDSKDPRSEPKRWFINH